MRLCREPGARWQRLVGRGFHLLYHQLARTYDVVSWLASFGHWRQWQQTVLPYLPAGGRVLEVGCGPGHLLADLAEAGYAATGLDASRAMVRMALRRLRRLEVRAALVQARAQALPLAAGALDAIVVTFPTNYLYEMAWLDGALRVLRPGGRLVVVEMATFEGGCLAERCLERAYAVTGQRGPGPDVIAVMRAAGFQARRVEVPVRTATVHVVIADKQESTRHRITG